MHRRRCTSAPLFTSTPYPHRPPLAPSPFAPPRRSTSYVSYQRHYIIAVNQTFRSQRAREAIAGITPEIQGRALAAVEAAGPNGCVALIRGDPRLAPVLSPLGGPLAAAFNGLAAASLRPQEDVVLPPGVFSDANVPSNPQAWRCDTLTKKQAYFYNVARVVF